MTVRVTILGGGSHHWSPRILSDFANTPALRDCEVVLHDLDHAKAQAVAEYGNHVASVRGIGLSVRADADRRSALHGADFVVAAFSVGGFASMRHDIEIPARFGVHQPIGDSIGPGGVFRALRSVPVVLDFARDVAEVCPDALFVNVTNPLSVLTRAIAQETGIATVGLCNELVGCTFVLSLLTDASMHEIDPVVGGVNHFPLITELRIGERDGFAMLRDVLDDLDGRGQEPVWMTPPGAMHWHKVSPGDEWTKADVVHNAPVKFELFSRFGVLPGAHDHHIAEFMAGFVHPDNEHGASWRVGHYGMAGHESDATADTADFEARRQDPEVTRFPSGELVAPLLDGIVRDSGARLPVNLVNAGQVTNVEAGAVVESMGIVDAGGVRARDVVTVPGILGEYVRRTSVAQSLTLEAALRGDATIAFEAMLADPLAGRLPYERVAEMTDAMFEALAPWLAHFGRR